MNRLFQVGLRREMQPGICLDLILGDVIAVEIEKTEAVLRRCITLSGGLIPPMYRLFHVADRGWGKIVHHAEIALGEDVVQFRGLQIVYRPWSRFHSRIEHQGIEGISIS